MSGTKKKNVFFQPSGICIHEALYSYAYHKEVEEPHVNALTTYRVRCHRMHQICNFILYTALQTFSSAAITEIAGLVAC